MTDLLGPDAEEPAKRESSESSETRSVVVLGWNVDLSAWLVDVADSNRVKAIHAFITTDTAAPVSLLQIERLCSLAYRYSLVYRELGVLMGDLFAMQSGWARSQGTVRLSVGAIAAVELWRAYLVWSELRASEGLPRGRDISSFRTRAPGFLVEFDGSLTGVGARLFRLEHGVETPMVAAGVVLAFDLKGDSQFQNAMELAAAALGIALAVQHGARGSCLRFRGDSATVLAWLSAGRNDFKSARARGAAMVTVTLLRKFDLVIDADPSWISSEENHYCDSLSRGTSPPGSMCPVAFHVPGSILALITEECNPQAAPDAALTFIGHWARLDTLLSLTDLRANIDLLSACLHAPT
jgi:hypothetical protein